MRYEILLLSEFQHASYRKNTTYKQDFRLVMPGNNAKCQTSCFILKEDFRSYVYKAANVLIANLFQLERLFGSLLDLLPLPWVFAKGGLFQLCRLGRQWHLVTARLITAAASPGSLRPGSSSREQCLLHSRICLFALLANPLGLPSGPVLGAG